MACDEYDIIILNKNIYPIHAISKTRQNKKMIQQQNMEGEVSKLLEGIKESIFMTSSKEYILQEESKKKNLYSRKYCLV